jgi:hypothetical protein
MWKYLGLAVQVSSIREKLSQFYINFFLNSACFWAKDFIVFGENMRIV